MNPQARDEPLILVGPSPQVQASQAGWALLILLEMHIHLRKWNGDSSIVKLVLDRPDQLLLHLPKIISVTPEANRPIDARCP